MARKIRMTPFARFFIFLLFAAPLAFLGASYFRGEDGVAKIKSLLDQWSGKTQTTETQTSVSEAAELVPSNTSTTETQISKTPIALENMNHTDINGSDLKAKLDSVLKNQQRILELLEANQKRIPQPKTDSL